MREELRAPPAGLIYGSRAFTLEEAAAPISVGRAARMDIVLADPTVSAVHAELTCIRGEWLLVDDGLSRNGSRVNGKRVHGRRRLREGDRVRLGDSELVFHRPRKIPEMVSGPPAVPPRAHRLLLTALAQPMAADPRALPATDTMVAATLDLPLPVVRNALDELCVFYGLRDRDRSRLAAMALELGHAQ